MVVPEEAVVGEGLRHLVYPVKDNVVERRVIRIGQRQGGKVEVRRGPAARRDDRRARRAARPRRHHGRRRGRSERAAGRRRAARRDAGARREPGTRREPGGCRHDAGRAPLNPARGAPAAAVGGSDRSRFPDAGEDAVVRRDRNRHAGLRPLHPPPRLRRRGQPAADRRRPRLPRSTCRCANTRRSTRRSSPSRRSITAPRTRSSRAGSPSSSRAPSPASRASGRSPRRARTTARPSRSSSTSSRNPEAATSDVRDRVSRIIGRLPDGADTPVVRKVDANAQAILWIGVTSTTLDSLELTDFLKRVYVDRLSTRARRRQCLSRRRAALRHAHLDRPAGARRARPHRRRTSRTRSSARTSSCRAAASSRRSAS